ncbi:glycosyltransferase [Alphaproteobacteria bacterium]|nr:glycosyltransferase [Alphaproteobacteria bacterium]
MHISIIIPIYNEANIIQDNLKKIYNFFEDSFQYEIIVVDDCSSDDSLAKIKSMSIENLKIFSNDKNKGKGYSIIRGIENSKGDIILTTDADLSADIDEFNKLLLFIKKGYSIVIGSRSKKNSIINIKQNFNRIFLGKAFNLLVRLILGLNYKDTQCGFKLYKSNKLKSIIKLCKIDRFCSDVEILYLAKLKKISVIEEGIIWNDNENTSVKLLTDPLNMFYDLLRIRFTRYK